ncbi:MAG TPA: carboxypeptidase-like regulatory domain-containing protein [Bryobacteraceae bacterium]|nr:carboxypeptidase-like regulatory domain-containing protein [Bryobacteraceae bacterium]
MKAAAVLLITALGLCAQQPPAEPGFIAGRVLNATNHEPVRRARLMLRRSDNPAGGSEMPATYTAATDDHGRFAMKGIEPGKYNFSVQHAGFADTWYGARRPGREGATLSLDAGQQLTDVIFRMTPQAVIAGRILDADGDPVQGVQLVTVRYQYLMGKRQLVPAGHASTDDLGEYRLFGLAPGRYYLQAIRRDAPALMMATRVAAKTAGESYVATYYPGVTDPGNATLLELEPGTQLRGMDFTLSKARSVTVRGHLNFPAGVSHQFAMMMLMPRNRTVWLGMRRRLVDANGSFELTGVTPGSYNLSTSLRDGAKTYFAYQHLEVESGNIDGLTLNLSAGAELAGQLRFEGRTPASLTGISVDLEEFEGDDFRIGPRPYCEVKEDGSFTLESIAGEQYRARVHGLPAGYYLKSARLGDDEVKESGIDAAHEISGPLILTVSSRAGQIEGVVLNARQQPVSGVAVVLVPEPKKRERFEKFKHVTTDQYGRYTVKSIEPGEYQLFAWEDMEPGEYMDPEFLKPVEARGKAISIHEDSREIADLQLIPAKPPAK